MAGKHTTIKAVSSSTNMMAQDVSYSMSYLEYENRCCDVSENLIIQAAEVSRESEGVTVCHSSKPGSKYCTCNCVKHSTCM